jgi:hypothetical protein
LSPAVISTVMPPGRLHELCRRHREAFWAELAEGIEEGQKCSSIVVNHSGGLWDVRGSASLPHSNDMYTSPLRALGPLTVPLGRSQIVSQKLCVSCTNAEDLTPLSDTPSVGHPMKRNPCIFPQQSLLTRTENMNMVLSSDYSHDT